MNLKEFEEALKASEGEVEDIPGVEIVESGDWEIDHKDYALKSTVVHDGEHFFRVDESRSGSYYTDYDYDEPTVTQVVPKQVTRTIYVPIPAKEAAK